MKKMTLRMSLVRSTKYSIGFAQMKLAKIKCDDCKSNVVKNSFNQVQKTDFPEPVYYEFDFENQNNQNNKYISMAEPIFKILILTITSVIVDKLKEALSIRSEQQWCFIGCDGLPYVIANLLIDSDPVK